MLTKETIKDVIISQRDFLDKADLGTSREKTIMPDPAFAIVITGIRRCGKSTFLNQILKKQKKGYYLNLEDPRLEGFELSDFAKVEAIMNELYGYGGIYFFDEIQNVEKWEKFVRYLVDKKEKVVITGSNASLLSKEIGSKLTGRYLQIEMFPFSYKEFLTLEQRKPSVESFEEYLYSGGFPEYLKRKNPEILHELLSDIVMRDIAVRYGIKNTSTLNRIALYLISNVGVKFSYNSIKNTFNVKSIQTVIDYVAYLENAYLIFTVPFFSYSYKQQQVNPKKVYSIDNGLSYANSVSFSKDKGRMLENVVFLALRRGYKEIFYFEEKSECDFLVKENNKITAAIQVCYELTEENKEREINGLLTALKKFNLEEGLILTYNQNDEFVIDGKRINVLPVWRWL
jgi:predicted AAA+ superfamily ATPase